MSEYINNILEYIKKFLDINISDIFSNFAEKLTFELFLKIIVIYFLILWGSIIIWVTKDIINRTNNILLQIIAIFTVLIGTPLGLVIYLLIRPSKTLLEKHYEEIEFEEEDEHDLKLKEEACYNCGYFIEEGFNFCPSCKSQLTKSCVGCKEKIKYEWCMCPFCGKEQEENIENLSETKKLKKKVKNKVKEALNKTP